MIIPLNRTIGPVPCDIFVREKHESQLTITDNPVEFGAAVSDHAYMEPKRLTLDILAGSKPNMIAASAATLQALHALQAQREPIQVVTGLSVYNDMLIERVTANRDATYSQVLIATVELREVIRVDTQTRAARSDERGRARGQSNLSREKLAEGAPRDRGSPTVDRGGTVTQPVTDAREQSFLRRLFN